MKPKIAIHARAGSFSDRWRECCRQQGHDARVVDCHGNDAIARLRDADVLLWHWTHASSTDQRVATHILHAAEMMGLVVYPNIATCWHFDDKVAQKYLLESIGAPLARAYVFHNRQEAMGWIAQAEFPKVFKLRRGASSVNVRLVKDASQAKALVNTAFGRGFSAGGATFSDAAVKWRRLCMGRTVRQALLSIPAKLRTRLVMNRDLGRERGYVYFQDYLGGNACDTRVTIIGRRAFAFRRIVRPGDFRASGSGMIDHRPQAIDPAFLETAFAVAEAAGTQSAAFDFIYDQDKAPAIVELSYCFASSAVTECPGHWDRALNWHEGPCRPEDAILADVVEAWSSRTRAATAVAKGVSAACRPPATGVRT